MAVPKRTVGPDAVKQFRALSAAERVRIKTAMQVSLAQDDAAVESRNRFRLRRPSGQFEFEFRDRDLRVFYRIENDRILVDAIGRKRGNHLFIGGRKVAL
jgi:hypothetical protein